MFFYFVKRLCVCTFILSAIDYRRPGAGSTPGDVKFREYFSKFSFLPCKFFLKKIISEKFRHLFLELLFLPTLPRDYSNLNLLPKKKSKWLKHKKDSESVEIIIRIHIYTDTLGAFPRTLFLNRAATKISVIL
jgi:hypothetical protein